MTGGAYRAEGGFVYVVAMAGLTKVGISSNGRFNRLADYTTLADEAGDIGLWCWTSRRHRGYRGTERAVINSMRATGLVEHGDEWFDAPFETVVRIASNEVAEDILKGKAA